jgi:carboxylesterase
MGHTHGPDPSGFVLEGGSLGCLLIHGFTGSPPEMRLLGEYLHARGLTVSAPLLPGHGTAPEQLNRVRWQDWVSSAEQALQQLHQRCDHIFVAGLSMGTLVTLQLALRNPVSGIVLFSPAMRLANPWAFLLPAARHLIPYWPTSAESDFTDPEAEGRIWHYDVYPTGGASELLKLQRACRRDLARVSAPALLFHSTRDRQIHANAARRLFEGLGATDKELITLHNSGHCMTVDSECDSIFGRTYGFILAHVPRASRA